MGLTFIKEGLEGELGAFIYTTSAPINYYIRTKLKDKLQAHGDYILNIETDKELTAALDRTLIAPMDGEKWILHIEYKNISATALEKALKKERTYAYIVYWIDNYGVYEKLRASEQYKKVESFYRHESINFLSLSDAEFYLQDNIKEQWDALPIGLQDFVLGNYRFDINGLADFVRNLKQGDTYETRDEIIKAIGVGSISADKLLIKILTADASTEKKSKNRLKDILLYYSYLKLKYDPPAINNFLLIGCNNLMVLKHLQVLGYLGNYNVEYPKYVDPKRLNRYKRYIKTIQEECTLIDLLNFKIILEGKLSQNEYDGELIFLEVITTYLASKFGQEKPVKRKWGKGKKK